ncbi:MAG TPA: glycosyltransferase family 39 protein [bacterium]|nr:glycosyltransferase family 39 protein [bacterium]
MTLTSPALLPLSALLAALGQWALAQGAHPVTLALGLTAYGAALFLFLGSLEKTPPRPPAPLAPRTEAAFFILILLLAAVLRLDRLGEVPEGLYYDPAGLGLAALRLLHEGIRPPFILGDFAPVPSLVVYPLAAWFALVGSSQAHLVLFFALVSFATFPLVYWTFRPWAGPRIALGTLFFLAVMRWDLTFSRNGYLNILVPFFMFGTLAFLTKALRSGKVLDFVLAGIFFAGGLYGYQAYKVFLALVPFLLLLEERGQPGLLRRRRAGLIWFGAVFLLLAWPVFQDWMGHGLFKGREKELFIGSAVAEQGSLGPLWNKVVSTALMFNAIGDPHPRNNIPGHRVLDDISGPFFVFGLAWALGRRRQRPQALALTGFLVMLLPGLLTRDPAQLHRMIGAAPFAAFFIAQGWELWKARALRLGPKRAGWVTAAAGLLALGALALNTRTYFGTQAHDPECWKAHSIEPTWVGHWIEEHPDRSYRLAPAFYLHYSTEFLAYDRSRQVAELDLAHGALAFDPAFSKVCFALDRGKGPTLELLKSFYPGGETETLQDPDGFPLANLYTVSTPGKPLRFARGLRGQVTSTTPMAPRSDPLINFTNLGDLGGVRPPFAMEWRGTLEAPVSGDYSFHLVTSDEGSLRVDGRTLGDGPVALKAGPHAVVLRLERASDPQVAMDFHWLWKRPGRDRFEVVPNSCLGKLP